MDKMSILKLILVTIPESILNIYIALLLTGDKLKLPIKGYRNEQKKNILKLIIAVLLFSIVQFVGRYQIKDLYLYAIYNVIASAIILRFVYGESSHFTKDKKFLVNIIEILAQWKKPFLQVCVITFVLVTVENIYLPSVVKLLGITTYTEAYEIPWANLAIPQVDRFFQLLIITLLWDFSRVSNNIKNYNYNKKLFVIVFLHMMIIEFSVSYIYLRYFNVYSNALKIMFFILLISMSIFNIYVYKATLDIVDKTFLHHKKGEKVHEKTLK